MLINKQILVKYIHNIISSVETDIFHIINPSLIMNPYISKFPERLFKNDVLITSKYKLIMKWIHLYFKINFRIFREYVHLYFIYKKEFFKKTVISEKDIILDLFVNVELAIEKQAYEDSYLKSVYDVFTYNEVEHVFLLRLIVKDYAKYTDFFKVINQDDKRYLIEFDYLNIFDLFKIFIFILIYPFKTLRLYQREQTDVDIVFNVSLVRDISAMQFDSVTRYFFAKKLVKNKAIKKIFSWCENQSIERTFNYGIRSNSKSIQLIGLQLLLIPENYFNTEIYDIDYLNDSSPHVLYVNGQYYLKDHKYVQYKVGPSLRYEYIFNFQHLSDEKIVVLGSYFTNATKVLVECANCLKKNIIYKAHPLENKELLSRLAHPENLVNTPLQVLLQSSSIVISASSGSIVEALACGVSVIILTSEDEIPFEYQSSMGENIMWKYHKKNENNIEEIIEFLLEQRKNNREEINRITEWYKQNYFSKLTTEAILEIFTN